jgi:hypothetical protein
MMDCDEDKEYLYKIQILQAFNLEEWNSEAIEKMISELYLKTKDHEQFKFILDAGKMSTKLGMMMGSLLNNPDFDENRFNIFIFIMLFNYDYYDIFHKCLCEYINEGRITRGTYEEMMERL